MGILRITLLTGAVAMTSVWARPATAALLVDPFDASPSLNENLARQSGTEAPLTYTVDQRTSGNAATTNPFTIGVDGELRLTSGGVNAQSAASVSPDRNFNTFGPLSIEFTTDAVINDTASNFWTGVGFGSTLANRFGFPNSAANDGLFFLIGSNGRFDFHDGGNGTTVDASGASGTLPTGEIAVRVEMSSVAAGPQAIDIFVNDAAVDLNGDTAGTAYLRTAAHGDNYLRLTGWVPNTTALQHTFDDFSVTAVPEPSSALLMMAASLGLIRRRRA